VIILLISHPTKESEKTAILMSVLQPQYIWLATGGKSGCKWYTPEVAHVLTGRKVILYPDLGAYEAWSEKAQALRFLPFLGYF